MVKWANSSVGGWYGHHDPYHSPLVLVKQSLESEHSLEAAAFAVT